MRARDAIPGAIGLLLAGCCCFGVPASVCDDACRRSGECSVRTERTGDGFYRCYAGSDEDCRGSDACTVHGRCFATEDGQCVTADRVPDHLCVTSDTCRVWGGCHAREGFCEPQTDDDCRNSLQCLTVGRCELATSIHHCIVDPDVCAQTTGCALEGTCTYETDPFGNGSCRLTATGSCEHTVACQRDGRCVPRPLDGCSPGCRVFYCGRPELPTAPSPCTETQGSAHLVCEPLGRCMRNPATGECEPLP